MNFLRKFIHSTPTGEVASIPSGKLFLSRSLLSPKGALECLYNDSILTIRQSSSQFCYQLCVTRAYQEGELSDNFNDDDEDGEGEDALDDEAHNTDERLFFLSTELNVRVYQKNDGTQVIRWDDVSGDSGDCYEFVVDEEIKNNEVSNFMLSIYRCLYEQTNEKSAAGVPEKELEKQFSRPMSPIPDTQEASFELLRSYTVRRPSAASVLSSSIKPTEPKPSPETRTQIFFEEHAKLSGTVICRFDCELRIFDKESEAFVLLTSQGDVAITKDKFETYYLNSLTPDFAFEIVLRKEDKPAFYPDYLGLSFNYLPRTTSSKQEIKLFIKFVTSEDFEFFRHEYLTAMYKNVVQEEGSAPLLQVSNGLQSLKLSSSDSRLGRTQVETKKNLKSEGIHKTASLGVLNSNKKWQSSGDDDGIFLGAFKKTENGIFLVSEITSVEDLQGKKHKSCLKLQDLQSQTLVLRDETLQ